MGRNIQKKQLIWDEISRNTADKGQNIQKNQPGKIRIRDEIRREVLILIFPRVLAGSTSVVLTVPALFTMPPDKHSVTMRAPR